MPFALASLRRVSDISSVSLAPRSPSIKVSSYSSKNSSSIFLVENNCFIFELNLENSPIYYSLYTLAGTAIVIQGSVDKIN